MHIVHMNLNPNSSRTREDFIFTVCGTETYIISCSHLVIHFIEKHFMAGYSLETTQENKWVNTRYTYHWSEETKVMSVTWTVDKKRMYCMGYLVTENLHRSVCS